ncbi:Uncharacterized protein FWK35_00025852 [Aphis craccivora]|uniref:Uncharacterized protein n=1 Tax=Aphis craccivora TaxID=307492 RepID=A0A6G0XHD6_APHCR|nr:Uncharacterized protein FWK35_00025852 [Aphis craccivora]
MSWKQETRPVCFDGMCWTLNAIIMLYKEQQDMGFTYILTGCLNSDLIENTFSIFDNSDNSVVLKFGARKVYGCIPTTSASKQNIISPAAPITNRTLKSNSKSSENSISTNDLMSTLHDIQKLSSLIAELKVENTQLKDEINILKNKVKILESTESVVHSNSSLSQMLQEVSQRELCAHNALVYGLSESSSTSAPQRISDDKIALENTLGQYSSIIPKSTMKHVRLGRVRQDYIRPLKIIFQSKDEPINFIRGFTDAKLGGAMFPTNFRIFRDKTVYERGLLRSCHSELDHRAESGEAGLRIRYVNGVPKIIQDNS